VLHGDDHVLLVRRLHDRVGDGSRLALVFEFGEEGLLGGRRQRAGDAGVGGDLGFGRVWRVSRVHLVTLSKRHATLIANQLARPKVPRPPPTFSSMPRSSIRSDREQLPRYFLNAWSLMTCTTM
jgi:hypothetical protein